MNDVAWAWPEWVPEEAKTGLLTFWDGTPGRRLPEDWLRMAEDMGAPTLGSWMPEGVLRSATSKRPTVAGRFLYSWGNMGRIVESDGCTSIVYFDADYDKTWRTDFHADHKPDGLFAPEDERSADDALKHYFCQQCALDMKNNRIGMGNYDCFWHALKQYGIELEMRRSHSDELQKIVDDATQGGRCIPVTIEVIGFDKIKFFEGQQPTDQIDKPRMHNYRVLLNPKPMQTSTTIELRGGRWIRISAWSGAGAGIGPACGHEADKWKRESEFSKLLHNERQEYHIEKDEAWRFKDLYVAAIVRVHQLAGHSGPQNHIRDCKEPECAAVAVEMTRPRPIPIPYEDGY